MSNKNIKSITASNFKTFVSILREEQKKQYMLVKFDYKNGYFCGVLSNDNYFIPSSYHESLAAINPESKELVLRQIMSLVVAATGDKVPEYELDDGSSNSDESILVAGSVKIDGFADGTLVEVTKQTRQRQRSKK